MTTSYLFYILPIHDNLFFCFSQKFYDEKNKKLDSGPPDLMRHEDVKTSSTRKLLPSGKVAGNVNGIPAIPSILTNAQRWKMVIFVRFFSRSALHSKWNLFLYHFGA